MKNITVITRTKSSPPVKQPPVNQLVHFELAEGNARQVCVAGTFNDWKPELGQMVRLGNGKWAKDLRLNPGVYEYRFVVDGNWTNDPNADQTVMNPFGQLNSVLRISE